MNKAPKQYSIRELFSSDNYVIPIYQRNYAWGESEITQLIRDIVDFIKKDNNSNYYIGTLIAWERKTDEISSFETIDGQQRLTTLSILLSLIKNEYPNVDLSWYTELKLTFDSRKNSTKTLHSLFHGIIPDYKDYNNAIKQGYADAKKALSNILNEKEVNLTIEDFCKYFFDNVNVLRVLVPEDTDLNHYFEIMNSRGEQLEKHEVLKAKCLEVLDESDRYAFSLIWEACSNMEKYVQYGFSTTQRDAIFGNDNSKGLKWNELVSQENVYTILRSDTGTKDADRSDTSIADLLKRGAVQYAEKETSDNDNSDRFNTIINFSNFLLHVLRIQEKQDIALDDKRLIDLFDPFLKNEENKKSFVKTFGYNLLKSKYLFDRYIIKREFSKGSDSWSLKRLKWYEQERNKNAVGYVNSFDNTNNTDEESNDDINREILMLLSMFHVSTPTLVYKHWLNGALKYVFENEIITSERYKRYLENLAKAFLHKRFLSSEPADYYNIIYGNDSVTENTEFNVTHTNDEMNKLDCGTAVENFIFNYLDYLLWQNYRNDKEYFKIESEKAIDDNRIKEFEYTFRSSVEHYYPQHPIDSNMELKGADKKWLDNFGNLCLISSSKNSRLSNYMPNAKKDHYQSSLSIDSLKQRIMMEYASWDTNGRNNKNEIEEHGNMMRKLLMQ